MKGRNKMKKRIFGCIKAFSYQGPILLCCLAFESVCWDKVAWGEGTSEGQKEGKETSIASKVLGCEGPFLYIQGPPLKAVPLCSPCSNLLPYSLSSHKSPAMYNLLSVIFCHVQSPNG